MPSVGRLVGDSDGHRVDIAGRLAIGGGQDCAIQVRTTIGPVAVIDATSIAWVLRVTDEAEPVRVNGRNVKELWLRPGDRIEVCGKSFTFLREVVVAAPSRPATNVTPSPRATHEPSPNAVDLATRGANTVSNPLVQGSTPGAAIRWFESQADVAPVAPATATTTTPALSAPGVVAAISASELVSANGNSSVASAAATHVAPAPSPATSTTTIPQRSSRNRIASLPGIPTGLRPNWRQASIPGLRNTEKPHAAEHHVAESQAAEPQVLAQQVTPPTVAPKFQSEIVSRAETNSDPVIESRRGLDASRVVVEALHALADESNEDRAYRALLEHATRLVPADFAAVLELTPTWRVGTDASRITDLEISERIEIRCATNAHGSIPDVLVSRSAVRASLESGDALLVEDTGIDPRMNQAMSVFASRMRSVLCAPLICDGEVFAILHLDARAESRGFDEHDLKKLSLAVGDLARAMARVRARQRQKAEDSLHVALLEYAAPVQAADWVRRGVVRFNEPEPACVAVLTIHLGLDPQRLDAVKATDYFRWLRRFRERLRSEVFAHGGLLLPMQAGSAVAVWGWPHGETASVVPALHAAQAATRLRGLLPTMPGLTDRTQPEAAVGIGLEIGDVTAGFLGAADAVEPVVIGEVIDASRRLAENAAPGDIAVGPNARAELGDDMGDDE